MKHEDIGNGVEKKKKKDKESKKSKKKQEANKPMHFTANNEPRARRTRRLRSEHLQ